MTDSVDNTSNGSRERLADEAAALGERDRQQVPDPRGARITAATLATIAVVAIALAVIVNWLWAPSADAARQPGGAAGVESSSTAAPAFEPETPALEFIPERILQFETISHHGVPGTGNQAAEAVYKTLNMNIEAQIEIVTYARVEAFASPMEAQARLDKLMAPYSMNRAQLMLSGVTPATSGEKADGSAYAVGWIKGDYATIVKASFAEWTPKNRVDLLSDQADKIVDAVDVYQRTGRQGVSK